MSKLANLIGNGIAETLESAKSVVTTFVKDKGLEQQINAEISKQEHAIVSRQIDLAQQEMQGVFADKADAREMYERLAENDDKFVRRFPMYLAAIVGGSAVLIVVFLFFFSIPDRNRDILNFAAGTLLGTLSTIVTFYFGSSYEGKQNTNFNK